MKLITTLLLTLLPLTAQAKIPVKVIDRVSQSVVKIHVEKEDRTGSCSGTVIAKDRVLTAGHCIGDVDSIDGNDVAVLYVDHSVDLAILEYHTDRPALQFRKKPLKRFETLYSLGYGFNAPFVFVVQLTVIADDVYVDGVRRLFGQGDAAHGMSGGPIIDAKGKLVGIVQMGDDNIAVDVNQYTILQFLSDAGL